MPTDEGFLVKIDHLSNWLKIVYLNFASGNVGSCSRALATVASLFRRNDTDSVRTNPKHSFFFKKRSFCFPFVFVLFRVAAAANERKTSLE